LAAPYPFDVLPNGFRLTEFVRGILKQYENYFPKYDPQNGADADRLCRFLMTPLPATVAAVIYDLRTDFANSISRCAHKYQFCESSGVGFASTLAVSTA